MFEEVKIQPSSSQQSPQIRQQSLISSQFHSKYQSLMKQYTIDIRHAESKLAESNIRYKPDQYHNFQFEITQALLDYHILKIFVKLGHFQLDLHIINEAVNNPLEFYEILMNGGYGKVYIIQYLNENIAIKSIKIEADQNFPKILQLTLKEVSILKICSILGCSLKSQNYFGFDLIVYNDCIQFAMSQGERKSQKKQLLDNIKYQLALMHSFHIVHCDIKPDNIIFCPFQNKFVFIDFGLSQVIKEECGFKSKTFFKGSPMYCSQEMISSLASRGQNYIDLYFNDIFGLERSIIDKSHQIDNHQEQGSNFSSYSNEISFEQSLNLSVQYIDIKWKLVNQKKQQKFKENIQFNYMALAFKFYYIFSDITKLNDILDYKNSHLTKQSSEQLLIFIKEIYYKIFVPKIFYQYFNCFEVSAQYKNVQHLIKLSKKSIIYQQMVQTTEQQLKSCYFFKRYFQIDVKNKNRYEKNVNFELIFDYLKKHPNLQKEIMLNLYFQCLRFDKLNLKFEKKLQLTLIFKQFIKFAPEKTHISPLEAIKSVFKTMVASFVGQQLISWKIERGFDVFYQMIILGLNINFQLIQYFQWIRNKSCKLEDKFMIAMQIKNLCILISIKIITPSNKQLIGLYQFLCDRNGQIFYQMLVQMSQKQLQISLCFLAKIIINYAELSQKNENIFQDIASHIQNAKLKRLTKQSIKYNKILFFMANPYAQNIFQVIKEQFELEYQNLIRSFAISSQFLYFVGYYQQLNKLNSSIRSMINCQQINQTFKFEYYCFLFNDQDTNYQSLSKYLHMILQSEVQMEKITPINTALLNQLFYLLYKIKNNPPFQAQNKEIIRQIYFKFIYSNCFWEFSEYKNQILIVALQILFASTIPNLLHDYVVRRVETLRQNFQSAQGTYFGDNQQMQRRKYLIIKHQLQMYDSYFKTSESCFPQHFNCKQIQQSLPQYSYDQLIDLERSYFKIMNLITKGSKKQLIDPQIRRISSAIISKHNIGFFFKPNRLLLVWIIQYHFQNQQFAKIYEILEKLVDWIAKNQLQAYYNLFISNLQIVFRFGQSIFNYSQMQQNILKFRKKVMKNPYYCVYLMFSEKQEQIQAKKHQILKLISLKVSHLATFAIGYLLADYYACIINLKMISNRKKIHLLKFIREIDKKQTKLLIYSRRFRKKLAAKIVKKGVSNTCCIKLAQKVKNIF